MAILPGVLVQTSPPDSCILLRVSAVAPMGPAFAAVPPSCIILQFFRDRFAQLKAKFAKLGDASTKRVQFITSLQARLSDKQAQNTASVFGP